MSPLENCPSLDELKRFVQGNSAGQEAEAVERHLLECRRCIDTAATVATVIGPIPETEVAADEGQPSALIDLQARLKSLWEEKSSSRWDASARPQAGDQATDLQSVEYRALLRPPQPASDELGRLGPYRVRSLLGKG